MMKSLLLSTLPARRQSDFATAEFRGAQAHRLVWLWDSYIGHGGAKFPAEIARRFSLVSVWSPELRYDPRDIRDRDAEAFLDAAREIITWANRRL
jgi:hypothetical protein